MTESITQSKSLIQACLRYAALRMHSKKEMTDYLKGKTTNQDVINETLSYLENNQLIDDEAFAKAWSESRLKRGKGDILIQAELHQKGVQKEIISQVISLISTEEWEAAMSVAADRQRSKWQALTDFEQKSKLYQILRMRGFSGRHIDAFVRSRVK